MTTFEEKVSFHQGSAPVHFSVIMTAKLFELRYEILHTPLYLPDIVLLDYYVFPNLKKWLAAKRFT